MTYYPTAYIYKFAEVELINTQSLPVAGATLSANEQVGGSPAQYTPDDGAPTVPPEAVLDHLGRNASNFNITDANGQATLPLLVSKHSSAKDSYYSWAVIAKSEPDLYTISTAGISFGSYPFLSQDLNTDARKAIFMSGEAAHITLSSPDMVRSAGKSWLTVDVTNDGDADSYAFDVDFIVNGTLYDSVNIASLPAGETQTISVEFIQVAPGILDVQVVVDSADQLINGSSSNANLTVNLRIAMFEVIYGGSEINYFETVVFTYQVENIGVYNATNVTIELKYSESPGASDTVISTETVPLIAAGSDYFGQQVLPSVVHSQSLATALYNFTLTVNNGEFVAGGIPESGYDDNVMIEGADYSDDRPVLSLQNFSLPASAPFGKTIPIEFTINNTGGAHATPARLTVYLVNGTDRIQIVNTTNTSAGEPIIVGANDTFEGVINWKVNQTVRNYTVEAHINEFKTINERDYADNEAASMFAVDPLEPRITVNIARPNYRSGETMIITGNVMNEHDRSTMLAGRTVTVAVFRDGVQIQDRTAVTNVNGFYLVEITANDDMGGQIEVRATIVEGPNSASNILFAQVTPSATVTDQPIWVWLLIIAILVVIIAAFTFYVYRYSLGKMAECGECHALIPEAARRCPNCGTDFETGTAKCSECNSWIPASSTSCPECGANFIGGITVDEKESEYIQLMREGYEAFVDGYREQAREQLGKKYSDIKFLGWWKEQPDYLSFEDWLAREEGQKTEKTFPCPSCGTPNVVGSKNCYRCGHKFVPEVTDEDARRVVKREETEAPEAKAETPARRKVVIKRKAPAKEGEADKPEIKTEAKPEKAEGEAEEKK